MSKLVFLHEVKTREIHDGNAITHEEFVAHGDKGLTFKYFHKDDKKKEKITGKQLDDGTFNLRTTVNDKTDEKTLTKAELIKELGKMKNLDFAINYIKSQKELSRITRNTLGSAVRSLARARARSRSRSRSRKNSRNSRKLSRNRSGSRKIYGGKRRSRKTSTKTATKSVPKKRSSRRRSRKGSRK